MKSTIGSVVVAMAAAMMGCSVHAQAPIKEVAYDFSDRDFYDRSYAPSPDYSEQALAPVAEETPGNCQPASNCEISPCGCGRVQVEHYHHHDHYYKAEPPRRRGAQARPRPRAEAEVERDDEAAEDTRRAERATRSRPASPAVIAAPPAPPRMAQPGIR